ncbi:MAG: PPC domain-containing protein, partial [Bryobacteraceae bacterium]
MCPVALRKDFPKRNATTWLRLAVFLLAFGPVFPKDLPHRTPSLASVFPQGSLPGAALQVKVLGAHLDRARSVVFLDSRIKGRVLSSDYTGALLEFNVAPDAPFGPHYFRIVSPRGASNLQLFRVGDLPHRMERESNSSFEEAETVSPPLTINAQLNTPDDFDVFRFQAKKGSTWVFDVRGSRNGNGVDTALLLFDEKQRKIAHSEDYFLIDPLIAYTFPETGWYFALVQSKGTNPNLAYQLDIRTSPHLETISPLSFAPGAEVEAILFGEAILDPSARLTFETKGFSGELLEARGRSARVRIHVPRDVPAGQQRLSLVTSEGRSDSIAFQIDATPGFSGGTRIVPPVSINGIATFPKPVHFSFDAKAGQQLVFEIR